VLIFYRVLALASGLDAGVLCLATYAVGLFTVFCLQNKFLDSEKGVCRWFWLPSIAFFNGA
jgi:hypothetical protein